MITLLTKNQYYTRYRYEYLFVEIQGYQIWRRS